MWHYVIALALLGHGVGHLLFIGNAWGYWKSGGGRAALFAGLPQTAEGLIGLLWIIPLVAFVVATGGFVSEQAWWQPVLLAAAGISLVMVVVFWGSLTSANAFWAVAFDLVVIGVLLWQRQAVLSTAS